MEKKDSYSDIESYHNSRINDNDSISNLDIQENKYETDNEKICCIEMINNNRIYISFEEHWTVKDLIKSIIKTNEFKKIYNKKEYHFSDMESFLAMFDLHLIIFRSIKDENETKIDFDMKLISLFESGLIKNYRFPFFYFKDNRNLNLKIEFDDKLAKEINETDDPFLSYKKYLPRNNTIDFIKKYPSAQDVFFKNKKANNYINKLDFSPLVSDDENPDWFIYDDESLNFLMEMEKTNIELDQLIKFDKNNHKKVYFQDNYKNLTLLKREYSHILIDLTHRNFSTKLDCSITHTPAEILRKLKEKMERINKDFSFEPKEKILKVKNLNDHILDLNEPIGKLAYINECIKNEIIPSYEVIDNPFIKSNSQEKEFSLDRSKLDMIKYTEEKDSIFLSDISQVADKKNSLRKTNMIFPKNLNNSNLDYFKPFHPHENINKIDKIAKYFEKKEIENQEIANRISINNFEQNKNPKIIKSTSKIDTNKFNDLLQILYSSYKGILNKKEDSSLKKINKDYDDEDEEDLDKKIEGRARSKGIGFKINENIIRSKRQTQNMDITQNQQNSTIDSAQEEQKNFGYLKQKSLDPTNLHHSRINDSIFEKKGIKKITEEIIEAPELDEEDINFKNNHKVTVIPKNYNMNENILGENTQKKNEMMLNVFKWVNSEIKIKKLKRPFTIYLHDLSMKKEFDCNNDKMKDFFYKLNIKVQIYCGSKEYTKSRTLEWKSLYLPKNRQIGKIIEFDLGYDTLPMFASIVFKIKLILFSKKQKQPVKIDQIYWTNFKLFDHNRRLKTGLHKIHLWDKKFSDDSYYEWVENPNKKNSAKLAFELESFTHPVIHRASPTKNSFTDFYNGNTSNYMINDTDYNKIYEILNKSPFEDLNHYDKETLLKNSYSVAQFPAIINRLFECIDYKNKHHLNELDKILAVAKPMNPVQALNLLSGNYLHENIRRFAVDCLKNSSHLEVQEYIIQLIQALKYEMYHDSPLARYLMELAIKYPLTIGHTLFWGFKSEIYNPNVRQRFGLYLEVFLSKIGKDLHKIFENEIFLIKALLNAADIPHDKSTKNEALKLQRFRDELEKINEEIFTRNIEISLPLNFKLRVKSFIVEKCKTMKSKKKPLWLVFKNADDNGEDIVVMFKKGDDLRQDILTLQLFRIMHNLWFENKIKVKMSLYNVICTGYYQGMLEIVKDSVTLAQVHKLYGGAFASLTQKPLRNWMESHCSNTQEEYRNNFLDSCIAYCMATWVLGVGDRHNDNIMVKKNGELFHIDFGHFLGHFKKKYGIRRERAPFVFTKEFRNAMGTEHFKTFKEVSFQSYQVLRKNIDTFVILLRIMLCTGIPELKERFIRFLETSLALKMNEKEAKKYLEEKLEESLGSIATRINFAIHVLANK